MAKKLYYKIGEACKRLDIQPYVLRYWETEFPLLDPSKSTSGQRVYSDRDLRVIQRIKELLYEEGYTIAGAKKKLEKEDLSNLAELRTPAAGGGGGSDSETTADVPDEDSQEASGEEGEDEEAPAESSTAEKAPTKPKPAGKAKKGKKATASAGPSAAEARLRRGVREALKEARAILEILDTE